jgi:hypothetical protein
MTITYLNEKPFFKNQSLENFHIGILKVDANASSDLLCFEI